MDKWWFFYHGVYYPKFLEFIKDDKTFLEKEPLERITKRKELAAYKHYKFWQCVDSQSEI